MKKLLLVTSSLDAGGAERWVYNTICEGSAQEDFIADYWFFEDCKDDTLLTGYKKALRTVEFARLSAIAPVKVFGIAWGLVRFIRENGPYDAIHLNGTKIAYQTIVMSVAKWMRIPVRIVHCHTTATSSLTGPKALVRLAFRKATRACATVVGACSKDAAIACYGQGVLADPKFHLFRNGIDLNRFVFSNRNRDEVRDGLRIGQCKLLLSVGSLLPNKNQSFLLEVMLELAGRLDDVHLLILGSGSDERMLRSQIAQLSLGSRVTLLSQREDVERFYSAADIFLLASKKEGLSFVTLEAQANDLPCLVSCGIPREAGVTDLVEFADLTDGPLIWAEKIEAILAKGRRSRTHQLRSEGWDIESTRIDFWVTCFGDNNG